MVHHVLSPPRTENPSGFTEYWAIMTASASHTPLATIFVVDDDVFFRNAIERLLRTGGYSVQTFASLGRMRVSQSLKALPQTFGTTGDEL